MGHERSTARGHRDRVLKTSLPVVNVLVVDDDLDTRELIATILTRAGFSVRMAATGREALQLMQVIHPELILLDIQMPDLDGAQFREQQRRNRDWIRIPTVVVTGSREEPQLDIAVVGTLHKPVRASEFLTLARQYCTPAS